MATDRGKGHTSHLRCLAQVARRWCAATLLLLSQIPNAAYSDVIVPFDGGTDLRRVAKLYLGDADLWPAILKASGLDDLAELGEGQVLTVPTDEVSAAHSALANSLARIQQANAIGAQVFAYEQISKAISLHDAALDAEKARLWLKTIALAVDADTTAGQAYDLSEVTRNKAAEARLSDRQGWVEGQRPEDLGWDGRELNAILVEEEKLRTLSRSTAQITFRDSGRLRLNANSHAVIQRIRVDPLKKREDAKVSLVEGDFYALLGGSSDRKSLEVDVPDVNAQIDSGDFWVRQDVSGAKFTNYDDERVEIVARGERVSLGRNEGVVIRAGGKPRSKTKLLTEPALLDPADDGLVFNSVTDVSWQAVDNAAGYWLEVAHDPNFNQMVDSASGLTDTSFTLKGLDIGTYYWRIAALDQFGLPGSRSRSRRFHMRIDTAPPFLRLEAPLSDKVYRTSQAEVAGETEPGARVTINGESALVLKDGHFRLPLSLQPGPNLLTVTALDSADNETTLSREIVYTPDTNAKVSYSEDIPRISARHFLSASDDISLHGKTEADARLRILSADQSVLAETTSSASGQFAVTFPLSQPTEMFTLSITSASGFESLDTFEVTQDLVPPEIKLEAPLPRMTSVEWLAIRGTITGADSVTFNGRRIPLAGDAFDEVITLTDGPNTLEMSASDLAGNLMVKSWKVTLDQTPPAYVSHTVKPASGGRINIEVQAADDNGLAKTAPFTLFTNGEEVNGFLRYNKLSRTYKGVVNVASALETDIRLENIELQDDAGNQARIRLR
ncbi:FecR domain-containing protein [Roseibium algae]|uniref:FecR domain-containing protein n=1 Tax=Roseibium algae TaxID=3123038 RepID=A0ABU8TIX0_9HYPH